MSLGRYNLAALRDGLRPFRLHWFSRLRSTSDHAAALRKRAQLFAPAVVLAGHQTAGRGRGANSWWSDPGCITATFVVPVEDHLDIHQLPLVAGLAIRHAAAELTGCDAIQLKWPNDIVHNGRKLAGLLCERIHKADLIGIGLNVNTTPSSAPRALRPKITSLGTIAGRSFDLTHTLCAAAQWLRRTLMRRANHPFAALLEEYRRHHALTGQSIAVTPTPDAAPIRGICEGLDSRGRLMLRSTTGRHCLITGHVEPMSAV